MKIRLPILELYILKEVKARIEDNIELRRDLLESQTEEQGVQELDDKFGLKVKFGVAKGRKIFDPEKAAAFLKKKLKGRFSQYFVRWEIERKPGTGEPPPELVEEMKKYFDVRSVVEVSEDKVKSLPLGLTEDEIEENCYDRKPSVKRMYTPTKVSVETLADYVRRARLDMTKLLLEKPK